MADYTTLALVEAELRSSTSFSAATLPTSTQVGTWISEASAEIDSVSNEVFSSVVVSSEYVDYDGEGILQIPEYPIISVSQVRYNRNSYTNSTEDWLTLTEGNGEHYLVYEDYGEIEFIGGNNNATPLTPKAGKKRLCLSYSHGRTTTPLDIQRWATLSVAKRVINTLVNSQSNTEGGEVTVGPITVKDPTSFSLGQIRSMDNEIATIKADVGQNFTTFRNSRRY
jgi:hypothetical protein